MILLVTGGCGFLGSNLAYNATLKNFDQVIVFDNLSRLGSRQNLEWLKNFSKITFVEGDVRHPDEVDALFQKFDISAIFHLAGQVAMTTSIANPRLDFETNALGTFNILDAVRRFRPQAKLIYASTNKVYGDLEQYTYQENDLRYVCPEFPQGFPESVPLSFHSPYGTSKGAADQYVLDAARIFGLKTVVFRHSSMYGGRQFASYDQGWIGWFCAKAFEQKRDSQAAEFTISGNGKQVRDILHVKDLVRLYFSVLENFDCVSGQVFNIGGGMKNSLSLLELFALLEQELKVKLRYHQIPVRISDQKIFVADLSKINKLIGWAPEVSAEAGVREMLAWVDQII